MGISFGGLFGGGNQSQQSSNTTNNTDASQRNALTTQSGNAVLGNGNITNDPGLVALGLQNNNLAAGVLQHIADVNAATIGKLSDVVKNTSNDVLQSTIATSATAQTAANNTSSVISTITDNVQKFAILGAVALGAYYFLRKG